MKLKIRLDTDSSAVKLVELASQLNEKATLTDGNGMVVAAKSLLGTMYAKFEFNENEFVKIYSEPHREYGIDYSLNIYERKRF